MDIELTNEIKQLKQMAAMYVKMAKFPMAEKVFEELIELERSEHGQFSNEVARTTYDLAESLRRRDEHRRAKPLYEHAISIWERLKRLDLLTQADRSCYLDASSVLRQYAASSQQAECQA